MAWLMVVVAGLLETGFAVSVKASNGFSRLGPTLAFLAFAMTSLALLNLGMRTLPVGPAYAVWTGIGAVGTAVLGMVFLHEAVHPTKLLSLALVVVGVVGLQLSSAAH